ncbi:MAG: helix-turn-helix domain-containing protein [Bacteroidota bacterium]
MTKEQLKQIRKDKGLTQSQMAEYMAVSLNGYVRWEQGSRKVPAYAIKIMELMGWLKTS